MPSRIISASRRTDIPAFYTPWFLNRIREGFCHVVNPFNHKVRIVSLQPCDCLAVFFWTRNPEPLFPHLEHLVTTGYPSVFHVTIVSYPSILEPSTPGLDITLHRFKKLSRILGSNAVIWRYDPILMDRSLSADYHIDCFTRIAQTLENYSHRCIFSFLDFYGKTRRRLNQIASRKNQVYDPSPDEKRDLAGKLATIAKEHGFGLHACCEDDLVSSEIKKAHCIDTETLTELGVDVPSGFKKCPSRKECGCYASIDIGSYDSCIFGCEYCYAVRSQAYAVSCHAGHDPAGPSLIPEPSWRRVKG
jgi:Domain of unknown function (DUF1848)